MIKQTLTSNTVTAFQSHGAAGDRRVQLQVSAGANLEGGFVEVVLKDGGTGTERPLPGMRFYATPVNAIAEHLGEATMAVRVAGAGAGVNVPVVLLTNLDYSA